jgi:hypothetical protein
MILNVRFFNFIFNIQFDARIKNQNDNFYSKNNENN